MNRFVAVRKLAHKTVEKYSLSPPVNVETVFEALNIVIKEEENQYGIEAYSSLKDDIQVVMNTEVTYIPRRRFTLAHELGHVIIPWHNGDTKCIAGENYIRVGGKRLLDTQELEANVFASELLMPYWWLEKEISEHMGDSFKNLIEKVSNEANTSIMATFFALENALPSGNIFFVKKKVGDYWSTFSSKNTCTVSWNYYPEDNMKFLDSICEKKENFSISQYEVVFYNILGCPEKGIIRKKYEDVNKKLNLLLNKISFGCGKKTLPFLDILFNEISDNNYVAYIICEDNIIKTLCCYDSPIRMFYHSLECGQICDIAKYYGFKYDEIALDGVYRIIYIQEKYFKIPKATFCDPNLLLKRIIKEIYYEEKEGQFVLKSINGVVASINSTHKNATREEMYNWAKYRFLTDKNFEEFSEHKDFENYIVNKIDKMISMRKI